MRRSASRLVSSITTAAVPGRCGATDSSTPRRPPEVLPGGPSTKTSATSTSGGSWSNRYQTRSPRFSRGAWRTSNCPAVRLASVFRRSWHQPSSCSIVTTRSPVNSEMTDSINVLTPPPNSRIVPRLSDSASAASSPRQSTEQENPTLPQPSQISASACLETTPVRSSPRRRLRPRQRWYSDSTRDAKPFIVVASIPGLSIARRWALPPMPVTRRVSPFAIVGASANAL